MTESLYLVCLVMQKLEIAQDPYSTIILENILSLVLQILLYLEAFQCYTISEWLNHTV